MTEQSLIRPALQFLDLHRCWAWRQNQGGMVIPGPRSRFVRFAHVAGISDIIGIAPGGRFLAVELKSGRNKPTPDQLQFLARVREHGGAAVVAYSLDELEQGLKREGVI